MVKRILKIIGIIIAVLVVAAVGIYYFYLKPKPPAISEEDRAAITLMPLPASLKLTGDEFGLTPDFGIHVQGPDDQVVSRAIERWKRQTATFSNQKLATEGNGLEINYTAATLPTQSLNVDESYELSINKDGIKISAPSGYGVLHALQSLTQLLKEKDGKYVWPTLKIRDHPRFHWRGLMIDVCRHWIPKEVILRNLEAMAAVKLNVFHWHLSDHQGFRVESKVFPKLHELGSGGNYYTQQEIAEVVEFARERGIRVIPEFDMPGHASSFLAGHPELASAPGPYKLATSFNLLTPVMDPTREEVYAFIDSFIGEMTRLFPDEYFHIGGDEVDFSHWQKNEAIQKFMKDHAIENTHDLQAYFNQRMEKILTKYNKKMIGWDEILNPKLSKDIIVQSWRSQKSLFEAAQKGSKAILSAGYYLDHKLPASKHYSTDPEILPGAVNIKPDTINWQQYDLFIHVGESPMKSSLVLYGQTQDLRGLFYVMENATGFENASRKGDALNFSFNSDFGKIDVASTFTGDSVHGKMSLGLLSFPFNGKKIGGMDMPGTIAPKIVQMKPLTSEQKANILGGEAAMWIELVSAQNIDSRIWPRMAVMAEKWWSPQDLTKDANDMYRRLDVFSSYLNYIGIQHIKGQQEMIKDLAEGKDEKPIQTLINVLEEQKYTERLAGEIATLSTLTPINEVVDAAPPESMQAVKFAKMVDEFLSDPTHKIHEGEIKELLTQWRDNHTEFEKVAAGNKRLEKVLPSSKELNIMSGFALQAVDSFTGKKKLSEEEKKKMLDQINAMPASRAGTIIAVTPALKKLIEAI